MPESTEILNPEILDLFNATRNLVQKALKEKRELPEDILATSFMNNDTERFYVNSNEDILSESLEWVRLIEFQNGGLSKQESPSQQLANQSLVNGYGKNQMTVFGIFLMLITAISSGLVPNESSEIENIIKGLQQLNEAQQNMGNLALSTMARGATLYLGAKNKNPILLPAAFLELSSGLIDAKTIKNISKNEDIELKIKEINQKKIKTVQDYKFCGVVYIENKEFQKAIDVYEEAIRNRYQDTKIYANLGYSYIQNNQPEKAIEVLNMAIEIAVKINSHEDSLYVNLVDTYMMIGDYHSSLEVAQKLVKINPQFSYLENKVRAKLKTSRTKLQFLYKENRYEQAHSSLQNHRAQIPKEEYEAAIVILQGKYNSSDPSPVIPFELAVMHQEVGQFRDAIKFYEEALNKETKPVAKAEIRKNLKNLSYKQVKLDIETEKYDEAKENFAKLKEYDQFSSSKEEIEEITNLLKDINLNAGEQMLRAGDEKEALKHFEELQNLDPNPEIKNRVAEIYIAVGMEKFHEGEIEAANDFLIKGLFKYQHGKNLAEFAEFLNAVKNKNPEQAQTHLDKLINAQDKKYYDDNFIKLLKNLIPSEQAPNQDGASSLTTLLSIGAIAILLTKIWMDKAKIEEQERRLKAQQQESENQKAELETTKSNLEEEEIKSKNQQEQLQKKEKEKKELEKKISPLQEQLESLKGFNQSLNKQLEEQKKLLGKSQSNLKEVSSAQKASLSQIGNMQKEIANLHSQIEWMGKANEYFDALSKTEEKSAISMQWSLCIRDVSAGQNVSLQDLDEDIHLLGKIPFDALLELINYEPKKDGDDARIKFFVEKTGLPKDEAKQVYEIIKEIRDCVGILKNPKNHEVVEGLKCTYGVSEAGEKKGSDPKMKALELDDKIEIAGKEGSVWAYAARHFIVKTVNNELTNRAKNKPSPAISSSSSSGKLAGGLGMTTHGKS